jgi:putative restriction endonuclease
MTELNGVIDRLGETHADALRWFDSHAGQTLTWSEIKDHALTGTRLVTQAKGIYKPAYMDFALSVRQTLSGPYADLAVERDQDGSWLYPYFQENADPSKRDAEATNRGLMKCMAEGVPVGVLIQTKPKPGVLYDVLGLAYVSEWDDGYFYLEGMNKSVEKAAGPKLSSAAKTLARIERSPSSLEPFDVTANIDLREKKMAEVVLRRGQGKFRRNVLNAYDRHCAISGCDAVEALEAAHISQYLGDAANHVQNGLLLRGDLHTLYDLGLLAIEPEGLTILLAPSLRRSVYKEFAGKGIRVPSDASLHPSREALAQHLVWAGLQ